MNRSSLRSQLMYDHRAVNSYCKIITVRGVSYKVITYNTQDTLQGNEKTELLLMSGLNSDPTNISEKEWIYHTSNI